MIGLAKLLIVDFNKSDKNTKGVTHLQINLEDIYTFYLSNILDFQTFIRRNIS